MNYPYAKTRLLNKEGKITAYQLIIAVPGITKDKVHISYSNDNLEVGIEEHAPDTNEGNIEVLSNSIEFNGATNEYDCTGLDLSKTKASVENGLIKIIIPVIDEPKKNVIKIG